MIEIESGLLARITKKSSHYVYNKYTSACVFYLLIYLCFIYLYIPMHIYVPIYPQGLPGLYEEIDILYRYVCINIFKIKNKILMFDKKKFFYSFFFFSVAHGRGYILTGSS